MIGNSLSYRAIKDGTEHSNTWALSIMGVLKVAIDLLKSNSTTVALLSAGRGEEEELQKATAQVQQSYESLSRGVYHVAWYRPGKSLMWVEYTNKQDLISNVPHFLTSLENFPVIVFLYRG